MLYARLSNGVLEYAPLNYVMPSGGLIVNFNKNIALMKNYGFKEVIDEKPNCDKSSEYLAIDGYSETKDTITINYSVKQISSLEHKNNIEDKIKKLESADTDHEMALVELANMVLELMEVNNGKSI
ncbi:hypothetical protein [Clostridium sp.]|jgi:hypothetical protein|uniref:hypothetical protein n=1 Tax=Clostridium sp. TaxID=1506 RepID=UPI0035212B62